MSSSIFRRLWKVVLGLILFPAGFLASSPTGLLNSAHPSVRAVMSIQREVTADWMRQPEVLGTAVAVDSSGATALAVYVDRDAEKAAEVVRSLPQQIRGVGVQIRLTDRFRAMRRRHRVRGGGSVGHTALQAPPIQLGTSGGWFDDSTNRFCCGGTLGALVQIGGQQYILSNYHVFEGDIVPGRNNAVAATGDPIIQPGLPDVNCMLNSAQNVATLAKRSSLPNNNVDCAIAQVIPGMVRTDGAILEIGPISSQTVAASINQAVKKSGRTTGLTRNVVIGLNATINVDYDKECGGGRSFTKTFTGQIMVASSRGGFLGDGDSGSLLVEDTVTNPRAIGLLFAGSSTDAIANPIDEVLAFLGATMVGN
jgi:stringent starvation protein B